MDTSYWQRQEPGKSLFPDIEWNKPEQKSQAGKLLVIGGHSGGFAAVASAYDVALKAGAGAVRAILPDTFSKTIPSNTLDTIFVPTNKSGGMSVESIDQIKSAVLWADTTLLIGDAGRNSDTAIMYEQLMSDTSVPLIITRDAIDLLKSTYDQLLSREQTLLVVSFAQLQKMMQSVYYPKHLLFSMQLLQVVDTMHKFSLSFTPTFVTYHQENIIIARDGEVVTMPYGNPMSIWRGDVAARSSVYFMQHSGKPLEAVATSFA